ncbi:adenylate cyclase [Sinorhizobium meliloti]|uniref:adenylate cyclase n=1 Tax=Rhizobium meliloti TaxID=382 RepID=UPI001294EEFA|nr:adenylate cyclase [Sinorhizobium meliloti]MQV32646.1 adenylate cyclase [Sinorhizobium meliloti]
MDTSVVHGSGDAESSRGPSPGPEDIRAQLARIISSAEFPKVGRGAAFLTFVVEEALSGRAQRLKGYTVAVEVFKRSDGFTQDDPVVRIEAGRLRRALERYYLVAGQQDPIKIDIPKGGYAPYFAWNDAAITDIKEAAVEKPGKCSGQGWLRTRWLILAGLVGIVCTAALTYRTTDRFVAGAKQSNLAEVPDEPTLVVAPFANLGDGPQAELYTVGLTEELLTALPRFKEIRVFGRETSKSLPPEVQASEVRGGLGARYLLVGGVRVSGPRVRVTARLVDTSDGAILWSQNYDDDLTTRELFAIQSDVASKVATAVAQPYGIIAQAVTANPPPDDLGVYDCTLRFYAYRADLSPETHLTARACLESAVARYPTYATAWAMLSIAYLDEDRFRYNLKPGQPAPMERALSAARRAIDLEPGNTRALQSLMTALFFNQQLTEALEVGEEALATNPNDTELLAEFGTRVAISGQWKRGADLLDRAIALNPGGAGYYHGTRALAAYMLDDHAKAVGLIRKADLQKFPLFHVVAAAIYAEAGLIDDARLEGKVFTAMRPEYIRDIIDENRKRNIRPKDSIRMIASLRKAGLPVPTAAEVEAELLVSPATARP